MEPNGKVSITYPSYKSFDRFIDVGRLKSLDDYITQRIKKHLELHNDLAFYTGPYRLQEDQPDRPGSRMIYLALLHLSPKQVEYRLETPSRAVVICSVVTRKFWAEPLSIARRQ